MNFITKLWRNKDIINPTQKQIENSLYKYADMVNAYEAGFIDGYQKCMESKVTQAIDSIGGIS